MRTIRIKLTDAVGFMYRDRDIEGYYLYPGYECEHNFLIKDDWLEIGVADEELDNIKNMTLYNDGPLMFDVEVLDEDEFVKEQQEKTEEELLKEKVKSLEAKVGELTTPKKKAGRPRKETPKEA